MKFLKEFGSIENLLANTSQLKGKLKEKVETHKALALQSKRLATIILDCPVEFDETELARKENNKAALLLKAIILGIVEGLTEFLPISSTGHLILAGSLLSYTGEQAKVFEIVIQAGAILAVCWEFRAKLASVLAGLFSDRRAQRFALNLIVAFMPAAVLGLAFNKFIKAALFAPVPVALAFIVGADHAATKALKTASETGAEKDIKAARTQFLRLKPGDRRAALTMLDD